MLKRPSVFILGAGAGLDIGMPTGEALCEILSQKLNIRFRHGYELISGDPNIVTVLRRITQKNGHNINDYLAAGRSVAHGVPYTRSIDNFIYTHKDNEKLKVCAKIGIAQTIVEHERGCMIALDDARQFRSKVGVNRSWLNRLMSILQDRVIASENLSNIFQNLTIINFNYDRCIEHFFFNAMRSLFLKDENTIATVINETLRIYHPYGKIGDLLWQSAQGVNFGGSPHAEDDLEEMAQNIRTYNEEAAKGKELDTMKAALSNAVRVVFLGFHFHQQNLDLIRPDKGQTNYVLATAINRSEEEALIIKKQISTMLNQPTTIRVMTTCNCQKLMENLGTTIAS